MNPEFFDSIHKFSMTVYSPEVLVSWFRKKAESLLVRLETTVPGSPLFSEETEKTLVNAFRLLPEATSVRVTWPIGSASKDSPSLAVDMGLYRVVREGSYVVVGDFFSKKTSDSPQESLWHAKVETFSGERGDALLEGYLRETPWIDKAWLDIPAKRGFVIARGGVFYNDAGTQELTLLTPVGPRNVGPISLLEEKTSLDMGPFFEAVRKIDGRAFPKDFREKHFAKTSPGTTFVAKNSPLSVGQAR